MRSEHLPASFRQADSSSLAAQGRYIFLIRFNLISLFLGAVLTTVSLDHAAWQSGLHTAGASLLALGLFSTVLVSQKSYKERWYGGRAIAESIKTYSWRYMMGADPFPVDAAPAEVDRKLLRSLQEMVGREALTLSDEVANTDANEITQKMRDVRALDLDDRRTVYLRDRIADQRAWYGTNALRNGRSEERLFIVVEAGQVAALIMAILLVATRGQAPNLVGVFATLSATVLAWLQVKRHEELAQAYGVAARELGLIAAEAVHVEGEAAFSDFVADAESAISREHTLWLARRDSLSASSRM